MNSQVKRGRRILREQGLLSLLKEFAIFIAQAIFTFKSYYVYENTLERIEGTNLTPEVDKLCLKIITNQEELNHLLAEGYDFRPYPNLAEDKEILNQGAILFCVFVDKELAHRTWVATSKKASYSIDPFPADYPHEVAMGKVRTISKFQRKGINTYVIFEIARYLKERGFSRVMATTEKKNSAYQKSHIKLGSKICDEAYHCRFLFLWDFWRFKLKEKSSVG